MYEEEITSKEFSWIIKATYTEKERLQQLYENLLRQGSDYQHEAKERLDEISNLYKKLQLLLGKLKETKEPKILVAISRQIVDLPSTLPHTGMV